MEHSLRAVAFNSQPEVDHFTRAIAYGEGMRESEEKIAIELKLQRDREGIGRRLRRARQTARMTLEYVAGQMGRSKANVGHWETGRNNLSAPELGFLARLYSEDCQWLITGERRQEFSLAAARIARLFDELPEIDQRFLEDIIDHRHNRLPSEKPRKSPRIA